MAKRGRIFDVELASCKILIVDDDADQLKVLEKLLESFNLMMAYTGEEAIILASKFKPDIVILDIELPGINGFETCRELSSREELSHTKIIMLSSKNSDEDRLLGYRQGASDYLCKPFNGQVLLEKIKVYQQLKNSTAIDTIKNNLLILLSHELTRKNR